MTLHYSAIDFFYEPYKWHQFGRKSTAKNKIAFFYEQLELKNDI